MLDMELRLVHLADAVARSRLQLLKQGLMPSAIEVRFGEGALEEVAPSVLRELAKVTKMFGLPVRFPEEHGQTPLLVDITVRSEDPKGGHRAFIHPHELTSG